MAHSVAYRHTYRTALFLRHCQLPPAGFRWLGMAQLPVKNTFIEVKTQDPIIVRPRAHTTEVVSSPPYLASSIEIAPAIAASSVPVSVDSKVRAAGAPAACVVSSVESTRRCSVTRTPDVLYARTPVGSIVAEPPLHFALPQAMDDLGRRRLVLL
eukprot:Skav214731  [mRNA]  locus=scaffold3176:25342:29576:+ [translate_table: standard]